MKVGAIEVQSAIDGSIVSRLPPSKPLPDPGSWQWQEQHGMFQTDGMNHSTVGAFVVRTADHVVLVDGGAGQDLGGPYRPPALDGADASNPIADLMHAMPEERRREFAQHLARTQIVQGQLPASLDALGVRPDDVTDLVLTHLHFDHIGWASAHDAVFFPNATIRCAAADLDYFRGGAPEESYTTYVYGGMTVDDRLRPVLDRVETWDSDCTLVPGVDVRVVGGHTPGSSVVVVSDGAERAMILGDMVHCPLELQDDDFNFLVDYDVEVAKRVREAYARELEGTDIPVAGSHFPGLQFGRLLPGEGVRHFVFD